MTDSVRQVSANVRDVGFPVLALFTISLQTVAAKWLSGDYPVLEIVIVRSVAALPFTLLLHRYEGRHGLPVTQRYTLQLTRSFFLFASYTTFMRGLAALPLAEIAAIRNSAPLIITNKHKKFRTGRITWNMQG